MRVENTADARQINAFHNACLICRWFLFSARFSNIHFGFESEELHIKSLTKLGLNRGTQVKLPADLLMLCNYIKLYNVLKFNFFQRKTFYRLRTNLTIGNRFHQHI